MNFPNILISLTILFISPSSLWAQDGPAFQWHLLYPRIRDRLIPKEEARSKFRELEFTLKRDSPRAGDSRASERFYFPLRGYTIHSIGGKKGDGYKPQGYDFFDGNQHKGHPGHDIFILDQNQDGLDDRTGKQVEVISVSSGVVVSVHGDWRPGSRIRGGNYIWIYEPTKGRYFYYAHLNQIFVQVGQAVSPGDRLGTVGRTGLNAYPKRSPTHLHLSVHQSDDGYPRPKDPYPELIRATQK